VPLAELTAWPLQDARYHEVRICGDREWSREIPDPPRTQSTQSRRHCRHTLLRAANHQPALVWVSIPANLGGPLLDVISHSKAISLALNLLPFAGIASLWFIAVVRNRLAALEDRFFATVFLGSGLLYVAMVHAQHDRLFTSAALAGGFVRVLINAREILTQTGAYALGRAQVYQTRALD